MAGTSDRQQTLEEHFAAGAECRADQFAAVKLLGVYRKQLKLTLAHMVAMRTIVRVTDGGKSLCTWTIAEWQREFCFDHESSARRIFGELVGLGLLRRVERRAANGSQLANGYRFEPAAARAVIAQCREGTPPALAHGGGGAGAQGGARQRLAGRAPALGGARASAGANKEYPLLPALSHSSPAPKGDAVRTTRRETKREEARRTAAEEALPTAIDTPEFRAAWGEWLEYKVERRQPYTPIGIRRQIKTAAAAAEQLGVAMVIAAMERAITNNWAGWHVESAAARARGQPDSPARNRARHVFTGNRSDYGDL